MSWGKSGLRALYERSYVVEVQIMSIVSGDSPPRGMLFGLFYYICTMVAKVFNLC